jgi:hypothetical protein
MSGIMTAMTIQAVVFDIGGVLEITPDLGVTAAWESRLGLAPGELDERMSDAWRGGSIGTISEAQVHQAARERLGLGEQQLAELVKPDIRTPAPGRSRQCPIGRI